MNKLARLLLLLSCAAPLAAGCGTAGPPRSAAKGSVTIGGQPLAAGRILFTPIAPNSGPAVSARIAAGKYELPRNGGPLVGKNRVEVEADLNLGFPIDDEEAFARRGGALVAASPIPPEFSTNSQQSVEIKPGEVNQYDVAIPAPTQSAEYRY